MEDTREAVLDLLMEADQTYRNTGSLPAAKLVHKLLERSRDLSRAEKAFMKRLADTTLEQQIRLDFAIDTFAKTKVRRMKPLIRSLMRMSACQILFLDGVPDSAACNEAVKLAEKRGFRGLKGFVNGVLRTISRQRDHIPWPLPGKTRKEHIRYLSVLGSMPEGLCAFFIDSYGFEKTKAILTAFLQVRPTYVRMSRALTLSEEKKEKWLQDIRQAVPGLTAEPSPLLPEAIALSGTDDIRRLPGFAKGLFTVQDPSSMLVSLAAGVKPGDRVVDVCAAPGGKALHAADMLAGKGHVIARDLSEKKCALIRENADRLGFLTAGPVEGPKAHVGGEKRQNPFFRIDRFDARKTDQSLVGKADVLFCDLPCSGLGIIGRKYEIKYNMTAERIRELTALQLEILKHSLPYLKEGGILLYSTCTMDPLENEEMVDWICRTYGFVREDLTPFLPAGLSREETLKEGCLQLFPGDYDTDGFFLARLRRMPV